MANDPGIWGEVRDIYNCPEGQGAIVGGLSGEPLVTVTCEGCGAPNRTPELIQPQIKVDQGVAICRERSTR